MGPVHHAIDYIELPVTDLAETRRFYAAAFGWTFNDYGPSYAGIRSSSGDGEVGGLNALADDGPRGCAPLVLLFSEDLDASVVAVEEAGGRIVNAPAVFPGGRRFTFTDPSGNELGVWATT